MSQEPKFLLVLMQAKVQAEGTGVKVNWEAPQLLNSPRLPLNASPLPLNAPPLPLNSPLLGNKVCTLKVSIRPLTCCATVASSVVAAPPLFLGFGLCVLSHLHHVIAAKLRSSAPSAGDGPGAFVSVLVRFCPRAHTKKRNTI
jgi:hypothetical protein